MRDRASDDFHWCAVYEIEGRLLVRTVDRADGLGIERDETVVLDGFPDLPAATVGAAVVEAMNRTKEIVRPATWPQLGEHAQPLLAASPSRFRSYRSWQRAARYVGVDGDSAKIEVFRWHPDLARGGWAAAADVGRSEEGWPQKVQLSADATAEAIGAAVLDALRQPPPRDA